VLKIHIIVYFVLLKITIENNYLISGWFQLVLQYNEGGGGGVGVVWIKIIAGKSEFCDNLPILLP
jgi:hypothetical protein